MLVEDHMRDDQPHARWAATKHSVCAIKKKSLPAGLFLASLEELPDGIQFMTLGTRKPFPEE